MALVASCSSDMELSQTSEKFDGKVTLTAPAFEYENDTRTALTASDNGIKFARDEDETIGVFPIAPTTNAQAHQTLAGGSSDGLKSSLDGADWALLRGNTYAAYYPFQTEEYEDYTKVPIDMTGQTQDGNASVAHIGAGYDYMYASATVPENGNVNFNFSHVISIVKLKLTMPVAATWQTLTLSSDDEVFITKATMNVATGAVSAVSTSSSITLNLNNVNTTSANHQLEFYMAVLPVTTGSLTVTVSTSDNNYYSTALTSKTLKAKTVHQWTATLSGTSSSGDGVENGHAYVDLGLPSGLKWATMNVGASSPEEYGNYYAWGETEPQSDNAYYWSSYKWCKGTNRSMTKYCTNSSYGWVGNKTTLDVEDDAACVNWGGALRMPTQNEQEELISYCYWVWTSDYNNTDKKGYIIYKAKSSSDQGQVIYSDGTPSSEYSLSNTHIFLPAAGYRYDGSNDGMGGGGGYWSASLHEIHCSGAWQLHFYSSSRICYADSSYYGRSVRAVCE